MDGVNGQAALAAHRGKLIESLAGLAKVLYEPLQQVATALEMREWRADPVYLRDGGG